METKQITLESIAGYEEEKEHAKALIDIFRRYETYRERGVEIPKGLLLSGDPGVGKTMFAKAIANEAKVPFIVFDSGQQEGDDAIEQLTLAFKQAKSCAPSILFIDELDETIAVSAKSRYMFGYDSDETRGCLKTLLSEIDGIEPSSGVLVIATSNCKSYIPKSLLRSGRLERQITFDKPSLEDRRKIIDLYLKEYKISDIDDEVVARKTAGFSGADIKALVNNVLIDAVRGTRSPKTEDFLVAIPSIRFGEIKKERKTEPSDCLIYHEIGHMLTYYALFGEPTSISLDKYGSIEGRVDIDGSTTTMDETFEGTSAEELLNQVAVCMGGIAGEKVFLGRRYCGSSDDIRKALGIISLCISNGVFGFDCISNNDLSDGYGGCYSAPSMGEKLISARNEVICTNMEAALTKALSLVNKYKAIGNSIYPILKGGRANLTKEDIASIISKYS